MRAAEVSPTMAHAPEFPKCSYPYLGSHCPECRAALVRLTTGAPWHEVAELAALVFDHNATDGDMERLRERLLGASPRKP